MPEAGDSNVEIAHHLSEHAHSNPVEYEMLEVVEAIVLAIVAVATAWSGYEAALWTGHQAELYGEADKLRIQAEGIATAANQERLYIAVTVVEWLKAETHGEKRLADLFEMRILPEFRPGFEEWKKTDPVHNPNAPPGPQAMTEFRSPKMEEAARLSQEATKIFERGTLAQHRSDEYVRLTVTLATILLLVAISQRSKTHRIRVALVVVAALLLCFPIYHILTLPRA